ncbi:MAG: hypothetical protein ACLPWF_06730 [Bryobacteraceae bacterium]
MISISGGLIVTRASSETNLGLGLQKQVSEIHKLCSWPLGFWCSGRGKKLPLPKKVKAPVAAPVREHAANWPMAASWPCISHARAGVWNPGSVDLAGSGR